MLKMNLNNENIGHSTNWFKHGVILKPNPEMYWMKSHLSLPTLEHMNGDIYRMYFCSRDIKNRSQIGYAEFNITNPKEMIYITPEPVLGLGELGAFDDSGVTPTWVMDVGDKKYLYYVGWNKGSTVRMHLYVGLAISTDGGKSFERNSRAPMLERISVDPLLTATLSILQEGDVYRMWYVSGDSWFEREGETFPVYNIKYAESYDAVNWERTGRVCITYKDEKEHALARPCVIKENGLYKMWFSHKGVDYKIGYAESVDGLNWNRMDEKVGLDQTYSQFDSQMQEYGFVVTHKGRKYMFYNGNEYGRDGICLASCSG